MNSDCWTGWSALCISLVWRDYLLRASEAQAQASAPVLHDILPAIWPMQNILVIHLDGEGYEAPGVQTNTCFGAARRCYMDFSQAKQRFKSCTLAYFLFPSTMLYKRYWNTRGPFIRTVHWVALADGGAAHGWWRSLFNCRSLHIDQSSIWLLLNGPLEEVAQQVFFYCRIC